MDDLYRYDLNKYLSKIKYKPLRDNCECSDDGPGGYATGRNPDLCKWCGEFIRYSPETISDELKDYKIPGFLDFHNHCISHEDRSAFLSLIAGDLTQLQERHMRYTHTDSFLGVRRCPDVFNLRFYKIRSFASGLYVNTFLPLWESEHLSELQPQILWHFGHEAYPHPHGSHLLVQYLTALARTTGFLNHPTINYCSYFGWVIPGSVRLPLTPPHHYYDAQLPFFGIEAANDYSRGTFFGSYLPYEVHYRWVGQRVERPAPYMNIHSTCHPDDERDEHCGLRNHVGLHVPAIEPASEALVLGTRGGAPPSPTRAHCCF